MMNLDELNDYGESREDCGYGEPDKQPACPEGLSHWWRVAIIVGIVAVIVQVFAGCTATDTIGKTYNDYRQTHEVAVALEIRGGMAWVGVGMRTVGRAAEIEVIEGEKPFEITPQK
jgi:hypothetical protein